jgi:hypothetical protein
MRRHMTPFLTALAAGAVALVPFGTGASAVVQEGPPGNNGTIKVHRPSTPADDRRNEPQVCRFYIAAFNFDPNAELTLIIDDGPPFPGQPGDDPVRERTFTVNADGDGRSDTLSLPDGQYKVYVRQTEDWNGNGYKQKVFRVSCDEDGGPGGVGGVDTGGGGLAPRAVDRDVRAHQR